MAEQGPSESCLPDPLDFSVHKPLPTAALLPVLQTLSQPASALQVVPQVPVPAWVMASVALFFPRLGPLILPSSLT